VPPDQRAPAAEHLSVLSKGEVELEGRMPWSSNHTFLARCSLDGRSLAAVYKPGAGERPLWDFPPGLYRREVAAFRLSEALGWHLVPETVLRPDAPLGEGSLQRFVEADFSEHYFSLLDHPHYHDQLRTIAAFDVVANNADRKSGHCLLDGDGRIWAIDNALCFHPEPKLRTVIWDFAGQQLGPRLRGDLLRVAARLPGGLRELLSARECQALAARAQALAEAGRLPDPDPERRPYPWPLV
jgi:uncharacterized repeat protein (TIGR03843 family)